MRCFLTRVFTGLLLAVTLACISGCGIFSEADTTEGKAESNIRVISNRADLISGGDALVEVLLSSGALSSAVRVSLDGRDITSQFGLRQNGRYMGLVTGLKDGPNALSVRMPGGQTQKVVITNYPIGGPIFSGPQIQPWPCLDGATDDKCNRPITYSYMYHSISGADCTAAGNSGAPCFLPYDPNSPPPFVPTTTTDQGKTVPFIIRVETGTQDRGQYVIAVLFDPKKDWKPWAPQAAWNGKTSNHGGSGCGTHHGEGPVSNEYLNDQALGLGFLTWETQLSHNTQNCNLVVQAESLMMAKEHIIEAYGPIRYTIGQGGSGGSIKQQQAANAYPGIFDGIIPTQSFTDTWSTGAGEVLDCRYLINYFDNPTSWPVGLAWTPIQQAAVMGTQTISVCQAWINVFGFDWVINPRLEAASADPVHQKLNTQSCNVDAAVVWDPATNPTGVRCSLQDYMVGILGRNRVTGYANRPDDNTGVQYGLNSLLDGTITAAQFVDLNMRIGASDENLDATAARSQGDPNTLTLAYRGGLFNQGDNMHLPIIDQRSDDNFEIHHNFHSYEMRYRLDRSNGNHDNQVIWNLGQSQVGEQKSSPPSAFLIMDQWLSAIEADGSNIPYEQKVIKNKPAAAHDACFDGLGNELPKSVCDLTRLHYAIPRAVAGEPLTGDHVKCQLKPLLKSDYKGIQFTDAQWTQLQTTFPTGVCDYTKSAVGRTPTVAWLGYSGGPGGQPLQVGDSPDGWSSISMRRSW